MEKKYKYLSNNGLAFDEDRILKKMSKLANEGWLLNEMTVFNYKFVKSEPQDLVYSMDYKDLKEEGNEYFQIFESSGWRHMCSYGPFHFFSAPKGTVPIYTDRDSYLEKYKTSRDLSIKGLGLGIILLFLTAFMDKVLMKAINSSVLTVLSVVMALATIIILIPSLMLTVAYTFRLNKKKI